MRTAIVKPEVMRYAAGALFSEGDRTIMVGEREYTKEEFLNHMKEQTDIGRVFYNAAEVQFNSAPESERAEFLEVE